MVIKNAAFPKLQTRKLPKVILNLHRCAFLCIHVTLLLPKQAKKRPNVYSQMLQRDLYYGVHHSMKFCSKMTVYHFLLKVLRNMHCAHSSQNVVLL